MTRPSDVAAGLTHDFFVSYRRQEPDRSWVTRQLVPSLRAASVTVFLDDDDFRLGEPLISAMTRGVEVSRYTLAVLSDAYLRSSFTEIESLMAEHLGLEEAQARLLAVMREPVTPRLSMRLRVWLDMSDDAGFDAGIDRLERALREPFPAEGAAP
jgi:hypothetical protein